MGAGHTVCIPEICDYEIRRNLILEELRQSISNLDSLQEVLEYLPLNTAVLLEAAEFWAAAHKQKTPTAGKEELDVDMILCAHAKVGITYGTGVVIATTNPGHIGLFAEAKKWRDIAI